MIPPVGARIPRPPRSPIQTDRPQTRSQLIVDRSSQKPDRIDDSSTPKNEIGIDGLLRGLRARDARPYETFCLRAFSFSLSFNRLASTLAAFSASIAANFPFSSSSATLSR
jgi:hypothetical protein